MHQVVQLSQASRARCGERKRAAPQHLKQVVVFDAGAIALFDCGGPELIS